MKVVDKNLIDMAGKPLAKLVRFERWQEERRPGALKGKIKIAKDFEELPKDIALAFGTEKPDAHCPGGDGGVNDSDP